MVLSGFSTPGLQEYHWNPSGASDIPSALVFSDSNPALLQLSKSIVNNKYELKHPLDSGEPAAYKFGLASFGIILLDMTRALTPRDLTAATLRF